MIVKKFDPDHICGFVLADKAYQDHTLIKGFDTKEKAISWVKLAKS